jgi:hypothetical protein
MLKRLLSFGLVVVSMALLGADSPPRAAVHAHQGKIVSVVAFAQGRGGRLVMSDKNGRNRTLMGVPARATVMLNQNSVTLGDLKSGDRVLVAVDKEDVVTEIRAWRGTTTGRTGHVASIAPWP